MRAMSTMAAAAFSLLAVMYEAPGQLIETLDDTRTNSAFYYHVEPGASRIEVRVIGSVRAPGVYQISERTDVGKLLALAGGPETFVGRNGQSEITLRLFRSNATLRQLVYEMKLEGHLASTQPYPVLEENDVLMVESRLRQSFGWREGLTILTSIATAIVAINTWNR